MFFIECLKRIWLASCAKAAENNTLVTFWMGSGEPDDLPPPYDTCGPNDVLLKPSVLNTDWQEFTIDLTEKDMTTVNTVFAFVIATGGFNDVFDLPNPLIFYIDDIRYL